MKWTLIAVVTLVLITIVTVVFRTDSRPITMVRSESLRPHEVEVAWDDDEPNQLYTVYWSNKPGIKSHDPSTYRRHQAVAGKKLKIYAPYKFAYVKIEKQGERTAEFEIPVMQDTSFTCENLAVRLLKRTPTDVTLSVAVLDDAEKYKLYFYTAQKVESNEVYVKDLRRVQFKMSLRDEQLVYISMFRQGRESDLQFLMSSQKIPQDVEGTKWRTNATIQLC